MADKRPLIASDVSRCAGDSASTVCKTCYRRLQIDRDDPNKWFPNIFVTPIAGVCIYKMGKNDG